MKKRYEYFISYQCYADMGSGFEEAESWIQDNGDVGYAGICSEVPLEEYEPEEFLKMVHGLPGRHIPKSVEVIPTTIQRLKYVEPTDDGSKVIKIPVKFLESNDE